MIGEVTGNGERQDAGSDRRVLITGAAGFIGSHLCERLLDDGCQVWGLDNFNPHYDPERKRRNLLRAMNHRRMHLVEGDVRDQILLDGLLSDRPFTAVVHLAARHPGCHSTEDVERCYDVNVRGTLTLLEAIRRHGIPTMVFASSSAVYGSGREGPLREDAAGNAPDSAHAAAKIACEALCHAYHRSFGLGIHCLRLFPVFGPRERPDMATLTAVVSPAGETPRRLELPIDGFRHSPIHVRDAVDGIARSLARLAASDEAEIQLINIGRAEPVELDSVWKALTASRGWTLERPDGVNRERRVLPAAASGRARDLLGFEPRVSLVEGLAELVDWYSEKSPRPDIGAPPAAKTGRTGA